MKNGKFAGFLGKDRQATLLALLRQVIIFIPLNKTIALTQAETIEEAGKQELPASP